MRRLAAVTLPIAAFMAVASGGGQSSALAQGAGCSALAGNSVTVNGVGAQSFGTSSFDVGDVLTFRFVITAAGTHASADAFGSADSLIIPSAVGSFVESFTNSFVGAQTIQANFAAGVGGVMTVTFLGCGGATDGVQADVINNSRQFFSDQFDFISRRNNSLFFNKPQNRSSGPAQTAAVGGANAFAAGRGADGQGSDTPLGIWADASWSGFDNRDETLGADGGSVSIGAGVDTMLSDNLLVGTAITFGYAESKRAATNDESKETSVGFAPYVAYQIDDVFAVQGVAGYSFGGGEAEIGGVSGSREIHRYFVAGEASAFQTYGDFSAFASVGVLWGQTFQNSYLDDARTEIDGVKASLGSVSATIQPSYLFTIDESDAFFVEPYLLGQYSYDFTLTKVQGAANDRDAFVVGAGANIFYGDGVSGALEASRTLGREDNSSTTARGTIRVDF